MMLHRRQACTLLLGMGAAATQSACSTLAGHTAMTPPMNTATPGFAHVPWSHQASIYEVNIRQYTPEGTLRAF